MGLPKVALEAMKLADQCSVHELHTFHAAEDNTEVGVGSEGNDNSVTDAWYCAQRNCSGHSWQTK